MLPNHPAIHRVILQTGHGLSNAHAGVYDSGAVSPYGVEAQIVRAVADRAQYLADSEPPLPYSIVLTPECDDDCLTKHRKHENGTPASHLQFVIDWVNEIAQPFDYLLSLHMDDCDSSAVPSGVLVIYDDRAKAERRMQAAAVARAVSVALGIPNRGTEPDYESPRRHIGIVEQTRVPALLIELGFVSNSDDVAAVRQCGAEAVIAAIKAIRGDK